MWRWRISFAFRISSESSSQDKLFQLLKLIKRRRGRERDNFFVGNRLILFTKYSSFVRVCVFVERFLSKNFVFYFFWRPGGGKKEEEEAEIGGGGHCAFLPSAFKNIISFWEEGKRGRYGDSWRDAQFFGFFLFQIAEQTTVSRVCCSLRFGWKKCADGGKSVEKTENKQCMRRGCGGLLRDGYCCFFTWFFRRKMTNCWWKEGWGTLTDSGWGIDFVTNV